MDLKSIQELLKLINRSNLTDVEIEQENFRLKVRRRLPENVIVNPVQHSAAQPIAQIQPIASATPVAAPPATAAESPKEAAAAEADKGDDTDGLITIKSPMIGTFYRSPTPEADSFVKVGDTIAKGQILCIVEAMKLFNEIESDVEGKIVKILVENSQPVEYDTALFLVEPA